MIQLTLASFLLTAELAAAGDAPAWWRVVEPCPKDTKLEGAAPPRGVEIGCVKRSGVWHGRRSVWFGKCSAATPCDAAGAKRRFEGEYRRGIEHGHWVFWRRDGTKALEGEYFAGKKSGTWYTWDKKGKRGTIENGVHAGAQMSVDTAILQALRKAAANGKADLAAELEEAAQDLKRGPDPKHQDNTTRGGSTDETIAPVVSVGPRHLDIPDVDMGTTSFEEGEEAASPYIENAVRQATRGVTRCYRQARRKRPGLAGEIVARYLIGRDGRAASVRVVQSTVTETMNQCVKRAIRDRVRLPPHDAAEPIEVISPWRFEAPGGKSAKTRK